MRRLFPDPTGSVDLREAYAPPGERFVRVNFAVSVDGAVTVDGKSRGLSGDADHEIFDLLRTMADVVLVGAGTVRIEDYGGARVDAAHVPPVAVVSRSLALDPDARVFTVPSVRPIVITCAEAPAERRKALSEVADVIVAGDDSVDFSSALDQLAERGLSRVLNEGGPHLFGQLAAAHLVDELCLTLSPLIAGGASGRIIAGLAEHLADRLRLVQVLEDGGFLFLRYAVA